MPSSSFCSSLVSAGRSSLTRMKYSVSIGSTLTPAIAAKRLASSRMVVSAASRSASVRTGQRGAAPSAAKSCTEPSRAMRSFSSCALRIAAAALREASTRGAADLSSERAFFHDDCAAGSSPIAVCSSAKRSQWSTESSSITLS